MLDPEVAEDADAPLTNPIEEARHARPGGGGKRGRNRDSLTGSLVWTVARNLGVAVIQIVVLMVMSRHLSKAELGWSATIMTVSNLAQLLGLMGIAPAIIQRPTLTDGHISTGVIVSLISGTLQTLIVVIFAGTIGALFRMPEVVPFLQVSALVFILTGTSRVAEAIIERELRFHKTAKATLISSYAYGLMVVVGLFLGWRVWAVVAGLVFQTLVRSILLFRGEKLPRPFRFDLAAYRDLMSVARGFNAANILAYVGSNADNFVVGRWMGAAALGVYSRAFQLMARPAGMLSRSVSLVLYPTMARSQDSQSDLKSLFDKSTTAVSMLVMPVGVLFAFLGPEVVAVMLGAKWMDSVVVPFQILSLGMYFRCGNVSSDSMLSAIGKTSHRVVPKAVVAISVAIFAYIGSFWGIAAVSWGILAANVLHTLLMAHLCVRHLKTGWWHYIKVHQAAALLSIASTAIAWLLVAPMRSAGVYPTVRLIVGTLAGGLGYIVLLQYGGPALLGPITQDIMRAIKGRFGKKGARKKQASAQAPA